MKTVHRAGNDREVKCILDLFVISSKEAELCRCCAKECCCEMNVLDQMNVVSIKVALIEVVMSRVDALEG